MRRRLGQVQGVGQPSAILPTPKIEQIKISYSDYPPRVTNPHIDHERETIIYKGRDGKRKFKHPGFTVKKDPRNLLLEVVVVLIDTIGTNGQSNWALQENLLKYMHLQVIHSESEEFTDALKARKFEPTPGQVKQYMKNNGTVKTEIRALGDHEDLKLFYLPQQEMSTKVLRMKFNFAINTTSPAHLTYFANVFLDVDQLINDYSLNLSDQMKFTSCSTTSVEAVYRKGKRVDQARVYVTTQGEAYSGPVYSIGGNKYVSADVLNNEMIRRDLLRVITGTGFQPQTQANRYVKKINDILKSDSGGMSKYKQLKQIYASMTGNRAGGAATESLREPLKMLMQRYQKAIDSTTTLQAKMVPNSKINDLRTIDKLSTIEIETPKQEETEEAVQDIRSGDSNRVSAEVARNLKNSKYFTNCMIAKDPTCATRLFFAMDWNRLAVESSAHKRIIERATPAVKNLLTSRIRLQSIALVRERIDDASTLSQFDNHMTRDRESIVEVIAEAHANKTTGRLSGMRSSSTRTSTEKKIVGSLNEMMTRTGSQFNLRSFEAYDDAIKHRKVGKFKYRVQVTFVDEIGTVLYGKIKELRRAKLELEKYYNLAVMPCNYDTASQKFTDFFRASLIKQYRLPNPDVATNLSQQEANMMTVSGPGSTSSLSAPWFRPVSKYVEILKIFNGLSDADTSNLARKLYFQLGPTTASPDSVLYVINLFDTLEQKVTKTLLSTIPETNSYRTTNSKIKQKLSKTHRISYQFPEVYDNKTLSNVGARFLYYNSEKRTGLTTISKKDFIARMSKEYSRFFRASSNQTNDAMTDLSTYRYSYIAPAHIQVGGKKLMLLDRGEGLYTADQYKDMMFSISLLQTNPAARSLTMPILNFPIGVTAQDSTADIQTAKINMAAITMLSNFGVSIAPESPFIIKTDTKAEPLVEVASVLGENTLLAIRNAISVAAESGESDESPTDLANAEISIADVSLVASSLVMSLANTGIDSFLGTSSPFTQVSSLSQEVAQKNQASKTLQFFDMTDPENAIAKSATSTTGQDPPTKIRKIPNQIKSLFLTKTNIAAPVKNWHTSDTDPIASPDTRPMFELLYFNLQKIEVLVGYVPSSQSGNHLLRAPRYELLQAKHLEGTGRLVCRMQRYRNDTLNVGQNNFIDLPVYNEYFVIDLDSGTVNNPNPVVKSNLYTSGGEYQTEDGTNYIGYYHIHKDKTVMSGATMTPGEKKLIPANVVTTDTQAAASSLVVALAPEVVGIEKTILTSIVSDNYAEPDYTATVTEEPIYAVSAFNVIATKGDSF
jgi:hypothetical protein